MGCVFITLILIAIPIITWAATQHVFYTIGAAAACLAVSGILGYVTANKLTGNSEVLKKEGCTHFMKPIHYQCLKLAGNGKIVHLFSLLSFRNDALEEHPYWVSFLKSNIDNIVFHTFTDREKIKSDDIASGRFKNTIKDLEKTLRVKKTVKQEILYQKDLEKLGLFQSMHAPFENGYKALGQRLKMKFGHLERVEYLSHYPDFEINFVFKGATVFSGKRREKADIDFLTLGYVGEGPRYCQYFLEGLDFPLSAGEIKKIEPGAVIQKTGSKISISYPNNPEKQAALEREPDIRELFDAIGAANVEKVKEMTREHQFDLNKINRDYKFPDYNQFSAFCYAVHKGSIELVKCLMDAGADLNAKGTSGGWATALYETVIQGNLEMADYLIRAGADVNIGHSPLAAAAKNSLVPGSKRTPLVELLLGAGANLGVDEHDSSLQSPLHELYDLKIVRMLLEAGADVSVKDKYGCTPLHYAACEDDLAVAKILLESGADISIKGNRYINKKSDALPVDYAKSPEMKSLIQEYMS